MAQVKVALAPTLIIETAGWVANPGESVMSRDQDNISNCENTSFVPSYIRFYQQIRMQADCMESKRSLAKLRTARSVSIVPR